MTKPSKETIAKRVATRRRNAAKRKRMAEKRSAPLAADALADARLEMDGSHSKEAIRRRILWVAYERKLAPVDIAKAMTLRQYDLVQFAECHELSFDWFFCGDLKGLLRRPVKRGFSFFSAADLITCYNRLGVTQKIRATKILGDMRPDEVAEE